jgi:hypothetical protein
MRKLLLVAGLATCLAGSGAAAQPAPASPPVLDSAPAASPDQATLPTPAESQGVNTSVTVATDGARHLQISSPPVPDTKVNRAKYGGPMSNAGRHTRPARN